MPEQLPNLAASRTCSFQLIANAFLGQEGLPFASIPSTERIHRIFQKHRSCFGETGVYSTAVMLWAFLSQVLSDGIVASCQACERTDRIDPVSTDNFDPWAQSFLR